LFRKKRKKCPGKEKNKQNESNKLPVASAAATAAATAAALLEAEEDIISMTVMTVLEVIRESLTQKAL